MSGGGGGGTQMPGWNGGGTFSGGPQAPMANPGGPYLPPGARSMPASGASGLHNNPTMSQPQSGAAAAGGYTPQPGFTPNLAAQPPIPGMAGQSAITPQNVAQGLNGIGTTGMGSFSGLKGMMGK